MKKLMLPFLALSLLAEEGEPDQCATGWVECRRCRSCAPDPVWLRCVQAGLQDLRFQYW